MVRRGAGEPQGVRSTRPTRTTARSSTRTTRRTSTASPSGRRRRRSCGDGRGDGARTTRSGSRPGRRSRAEALTAVPASVPGRSVSRRLADLLHRHRDCSSGCCSPAPLGWLVIAYLGSLAVLFVAAFWHLDDVQRQGRALVQHGRTSRRCANDHVYRTIVLRTVGDRGGGHGDRRAARLPDRVLHGEGRVAAGARAAGRRGADAAVVELPGEGLRLAHDPQRGRDPQLGASARSGINGPGFGNVATWLVFTYLWLPYMILPIYAGLERIPDSLLDASGDLGAAPGRTFRRVVLPLGVPGGRRRLDLHVLADARRLHHAERSSLARSSSATSSTRTSASPTTCRWPRRSRRSRSW